MPKQPPGKKIFDSRGIWNLYKDNDKWVITLTSPGISSERFYKMAVLSEDFTSGDIIIDKGLRPMSREKYPIEYPFDELFMINLLCRGRGVEVHACGVIDRGEGLLFIGVSGAGKSTMANLWKQYTKATLLSDDRIVIRKKDDSYRMYGTPWHGDAQVAFAGSAPLKKIFFIVQSDKNYAKPLRGMDALKRLVVCCFPTFWDRVGMSFILDYCNKLTNNVEIFELGFLPDESVIDFVMEKQTAQVH